MTIGFDAKRYFHNETGLGNYSRTFVNGLVQLYPENQYILYNPKKSKHFQVPDSKNLKEIRPQAPVSKMFPALWRSNWVTNDFKKRGLDLYHGLSHEIPVGINKMGIKSIVTIHDLIFERYPDQFKKIDVQLYRRKFKYACAHANRIIAISTQTKNDLIDIYKVDERKIDICFQSCHPAFAQETREAEKNRLRQQFQLPNTFFLYVGSIIERKNLLTICKAMLLLNGDLKIPLVVVGNGKRYKENVKAFLAQNDLTSQVYFLSDQANNKNALKNPYTLAGIYKLATALIYPSFFEGFGIPVLEALQAGLPVITSNSSCLPETGGSAALYVDPANSEELAAAMKQLYNDEMLRNALVAKGKLQAKKFSLETCTNAVMDVYKKVVA
ncbi:MAG TPA: glycosyltransferase family 1 protein [Chitinophagaceae bacterium]|nr:glycosyltransferase family 1 protein [Chitinophagaceae bacterium]